MSRLYLALSDLAEGNSILAQPVLDSKGLTRQADMGRVYSRDPDPFLTQSKPQSQSEEPKEESDSSPHLMGRSSTLEMIDILGKSQVCPSGRALRRVTIRGPVSESTSNCHEVVGQGTKGVVTEEQVGLIPLIALVKEEKELLNEQETVAPKMQVKEPMYVSPDWIQTLENYSCLLLDPNPEHMNAIPRLQLPTQEKSKVREESDSTIPDPSHQTVTSTPPVIAPFIDVSSSKPSLLNKNLLMALLKVLEGHTADLSRKTLCCLAQCQLDRVDLEEEFDLRVVYSVNDKTGNKVKDHREDDSDDDEDDDDDEGPSAGSNQDLITNQNSEQSSDDISMQDEGNDSDMEDTDNAHIPKVSTTTWFKPIPESERPATPEPEWTIPPI
ncbi:hypothetical protein Tco_0541363 [Tanacetum coccineum]